LFKNVAERGKWGGYLMHAYNSYKENQFEESFVLYSFLAEMGYEVAQSNTGFILDRGEVHLLNTIFSLYKYLFNIYLIYYIGKKQKKKFDKLFFLTFRRC